MLFRSVRDYDEARQLFRQILGQDSNNRVWRVELANLELHLLRLLARTTPPRALLAEQASLHHGLQTLLALDPRNSGWLRSEATARTRLAALQLAAGDMAAARDQSATAVASLQALYRRNPGSLHARLALVESLLLAASIAPPGMTGPVRAQCEAARDVLGADMEATMNHQLLDPWVRANICLQNTAAIDSGVRRLRQINYRDHSYMQFLSNHL